MHLISMREVSSGVLVYFSPIFIAGGSIRQYVDIGGRLVRHTMTWIILGWRDRSKLKFNDYDWIVCKHL